MTDNEIIKNLKCCIGDDEGKNCYLCSLYEAVHCQEFLLIETLNLIERKQFKISSLEGCIEGYKSSISHLINIVDSNYHTGRNETAKEFAEMLKDIYRKDKKYSLMNAPILVDRLFSDIDIIRKEIVKEDDAFVQGTELALDYALPVPEEDFKKYKEIVGESE